MVASLDKAVAAEVFADLRSGLTLLKEGHPEAAQAAVLRGWCRIPEPRYGWDISQITVIKIAKFYRDSGLYAEGIRWAQDIMKCNPLPKDGEPYVVLGSVYYASGDVDAAREQFQKAYALAGKRAFDGEDPEYLKLAKPKGGR